MNDVSARVSSAMANINWIEVVGSVVAVALVSAALLAIHWVVVRLLGRLADRLDAPALRSVVRRSCTPVRVILPIMAATALVPGMGLPDRYERVTLHALSIAMIVAITWLLIRLTLVADDVARARFPIDGPGDNRRARRIATVVRIVRQTGVVVLIIVGAAVALMTFPQARQLGASVLASAGIAGIVIGVAARPALENIIAGLQIAFTEPITLNDAVVYNDEFGFIEEITLTYVVVRIWDRRRMVVPLGKFIQEPFENWTRSDLEISGTVFMHLDFNVPVEDVRTHAREVVGDDPRWDGRTFNLAVTDLKDQRVELRITIGARNAGDLWDLRCALREKLAAWVRHEHADTLARTRIQVVGTQEQPVLTKVIPDVVVRGTDGLATGASDRPERANPG